MSIEANPRKTVLLKTVTVNPSDFSHQPPAPTQNYPEVKDHGTRFVQGRSTCEVFPIQQKTSQKRRSQLDHS